MNRWRWTVLRMVEQAGLPGLIAGVLAAGALVAWLAVLRPLAGQVHALEDEDESLADRVAVEHVAPRPPTPATPERQVADFEQGFPAEKGLAPAYGQLFKLAQKHGVALRHGEFRLNEAGSGTLAAYVMNLPVEADYRSLRAFVADALHAMPGLALEELELHRDDAKATQLQAKLRFVLYVGSRTP